MLKGIWTDLRLSWRRVMKHWGVSLLAIGILAIGIGGTVEIYSLSRALLQPHLRVSQPNHLAILWQYDPNNTWVTMSPANYQDFRRSGAKVARMAAFTMPAVVFRLPGQAPLQANGLKISRHYFSVLGAGMQMGQTFASSDYHPGPATAVILTHTFWDHMLHRQPGLIGERVQINGGAAVITGIASSSLEFPMKEGVVMPLALTAAQQRMRNRDDMAIQVLARRRRGVTAGTERAQLQSIAQRLAARHPKTDKTLRAGLMNPAVFMNGNLTPVFIGMLMAGSLMLLLLVCANVANLQLAQALGRSRELALRAALGATRGRLLRETLMDACVVAMLGGIAGIFAAAWFCQVMKADMPERIAIQIMGWNRLGVNYPELLFALALAMASGIVAGLAPGWFAARPHLIPVLKEGGYANLGSSRHRLRKALIIGQMTLAFTLLLGAVLAVKGFEELMNRTAQYEGGRRLTFQVRLPVKTYPTALSRLEFVQRLLPQFRRLPGVQSIALGTTLPFNNGGNSPSRYMNITTARRDSEKKPWVTPRVQLVNPRFFPGLRVGLLAGRNFDAQDGAQTPAVVIVSRNLARQLWPGQDAVGKMILEPRKSETTIRATVVGVAPVVQYNLWNKITRPTLYVPYEQAGNTALAAGNQLTALTFILHARVAPMSLAPAVRQCVASLNPMLAVGSLHTLQRFFILSNTPLRMIDRKLVTLGVEALLIAAVGLFGVMTAFMLERRRELGIRMILGADGNTIRWLALRQGLRLTGWGILISAPLAWIINNYLAKYLYGVAPMEWELMLAIAVVLGLATLAACYAPAQAAAKYDPAQVIRME